VSLTPLAVPTCQLVLEFPDGVSSAMSNTERAGLSRRNDKVRGRTS
jgi:hypothetical protein